MELVKNPRRQPVNTWNLLQKLYLKNNTIVILLSSWTQKKKADEDAEREFRNREGLVRGLSNLISRQQSDVGVPVRSSQRCRKALFYLRA